MNSRLIGAFKEEEALTYLQNNDYIILQHNYVCPLGEIDVIAKKDNTIHFIEIKYRKNNTYGYAANALSQTKLNKMYKCANYYLKEHKLIDASCVFDLIAIEGENIVFLSDIIGSM